MMRRTYFSVLVLVLGTSSCADANVFDWSVYQSPDWKKYQARGVHSPNLSVRPQMGDPSRTLDRFTFGDLKFESDESLARRLLGEIGKRIAFIDRHQDRWQYYDDDGDVAESVDLYTRPYALGSQFGLCGVEKYSIEFGDDGRVEAVSVNQRYGIEGPIFQKGNFDWDNYNEMCASAPALNAPSYFPAPDSITADDAAELLVVLFDLASKSGTLPFKLECRLWQGKGECRPDVRQYVADLRLDNIDDFSLINCPLIFNQPKSICFTVTTGRHQLGPFPKYITVKGSTHMNNIRLDSVEILESQTIS